MLYGQRCVYRVGYGKFSHCSLREDNTKRPCFCKRGRFCPTYWYRSWLPFVKCRYRIVLFRMVVVITGFVSYYRGYHEFVSHCRGYHGFCVVVISVVCFDSIVAVITGFVSHCRSYHGFIFALSRLSRVLCRIVAVITGYISHCRGYHGLYTEPQKKRYKVVYCIIL